MTINLLLLVALLYENDTERLRIQNHLAIVEAELRAADTSSLSPAQKSWRSRLADELHLYWSRGEFPSNTYRSFATPVFVDRSGVHCAVAHLIRASGHDDFVKRIAAKRNTAYIAQLADEPDLLAWLHEHGLTVAEAARIQPAYEPRDTGEGCGGDDDCASDMCHLVDDNDLWFGYCTESCSTTASCPEGYLGVQMECGQSGDGGGRCLYPTPLPGGIGWPCEDDPTVCWGICLTEDYVPICSTGCLDSSDCPRDYECRHGRGVDDTVCLPKDHGCAAGTAASTGMAALLVLLLTASLSRRRRTGDRHGGYPVHPAAEARLSTHAS